MALKLIKIFTSAVFYMLLLLLLVLILESLFLLGYDTLELRFALTMNILFLLLLVVTIYWEKILSLGNAILDHHQLLEFKSSKKGFLPKSPSAREKYIYMHGEHNFFITASLVSFVTISWCMFNFIRANQVMWPLMLYLVFTVIYFLVSTVINIFFKRFDITEHAKIVQKWQRNLGESLDIFLPTAGESIEVLKNTWDGVIELKRNYPGIVTVYCLDDSAREEVKFLADRYNFKYIVRPNRGWFKKAGNLRHGFSISIGKYIAIFDADFRPRYDFLKELLPYFYENPTIGLVQSPQYFDVNSDQNWLQRGAGAVQELFYRFSQVSRQNHDASICVGSNAIYRRSALLQMGGTALIEHSEDVHTGFNMRMNGWTIQYVPLVLAKGLCPDDMKSFFKQQYRWCLGSMSLLGSKKFWKAKISFSGRLAYFSGFLYYIHTAISSFFVPIIPLALIFLYPNQVTLENYILILPSIIFVQVIYPLWHNSTYGIEAWSTRSVYGWAHLFAIFDKITGRAMQWQPTGVKVKKDNRYLVFRIMQVLFNFIPGLIWVYAAGIRVFVLEEIIFLPLLFSGFYFLLITAKVTFYGTESLLNFNQSYKQAANI